MADKKYTVKLTSRELIFLVNACRENRAQEENEWQGHHDEWDTAALKLYETLRKRKV